MVQSITQSKNTSSGSSKNIMSEMKTLSSLAKFEMNEVTPLKVTYVSNKKARIIKSRCMSEVSTDEE